MQRLFLWSLIGIVAITPLPLGSNRPLGWSLLALEIGVLLVVWSFHRIWTGQPLSIPMRRIRAPLAFFVIAYAWGLIQLIPNIPFGLAHPAWREVSNFFGTNVPGRISIDPDWTATILMRWLAYAATFWLSMQLCRDRAAATTALKAFALIGAAYALYGLLALFAFDDTILLYEKWTGRGSLSSTFVNRNSYATFAGLGVVSTAALIIAEFQKHSRKSASLKEQTYYLLTRSLPQNVLLYVGLFVIGTALLLTGSRAGALSSLAAFMVLVWQLMRMHKGNAKSLAARLAMVGVGIVLVVSFSGDLLRDRLSQGGDQQRAEVYDRTINAIGDYALLGSGLGSFPQIFPLYRDNENLISKFVEKAHNSYLGNMLELGLLASASLFLALLSLARTCWRGLRLRSRDRYFAAMGLSVSVLVGLHSLVDFSLEIPAVTIAYMFLMGIAVAQSFSSRQN